MENPSTWGPVENVICDAIIEWNALQASAFCGGSQEMAIANALRAAGLVIEFKGKNGNIS